MSKRCDFCSREITLGKSGYPLSYNIVDNYSLEHVEICYGCLHWSMAERFDDNKHKNVVKATYRGEATGLD